MQCPRHPLSLLLCLLLVGVGTWFSLRDADPLAVTALGEAGIVLLPQARTLPAAGLRSSAGQAFTPAFFQGKWTLVLFGYTFCPDICPTALSELRRIRAALPEDIRARLQVTMVSVDPDRDSPERLRQYLNYFDPSFTGMTGELAQVQKASAAMGLPFVPGDTRREHYTVDHSGNLGLIDPQGRQVGFVRGPLREQALQRLLPALLKLDRLP